MIPKQFINWCEDVFKEDMDKIDIEHEYDLTLNTSENQNEFRKKFPNYFEDNSLKEKADAIKEEQDHLEKKPKDKDVEFMKQLCSKALTVMIIGKRGSGKTCLGFYLLEQLKGITTRHLVTVAFPKKTPFKNYEKIEDVPNNSIALLDEGSMQFDARRAMSKENISMSNILKIARHNDITVILITQNTADIEVRTLRIADIFLLKEPSLVQIYLERSFIKRLYQFVSPIFTDKDTEWISNYYIFCDTVAGLYTYEMPTFWNDDISKAHRRNENKVVPNLFAKKNLLEKKVLNTHKGTFLVVSSKTNGGKK